MADDKNSSQAPMRQEHSLRRPRTLAQGRGGPRTARSHSVGVQDKRLPNCTCDLLSPDPLEVALELVAALPGQKLTAPRLVRELSMAWVSSCENKHSGNAPKQGPRLKSARIPKRIERASDSWT